MFLDIFHSTNPMQYSENKRLLLPLQLMPTFVGTPPSPHMVLEFLELWRIAFSKHVFVTSLPILFIPLTKASSVALILKNVQPSEEGKTWKDHKGTWERWIEEAPDARFQSRGYRKSMTHSMSRKPKFRLSWHEKWKWWWWPEMPKEIWRNFHSKNAIEGISRRRKGQDRWQTQGRW